jgi:putative transposase
MGQSLAQIYIHLVFATKFRQPLISEKIEPQLHAFIAGTLKQFESPALIINSVPDHIHILFRLSKNYTLARVVEEVKKRSSRWMKTLPDGNQGFTWQVGYGAFSVSSSKLETVKTYIARQKIHHRVHSFREEVEEFIRQYDVRDYDEKYFWE